ncbi:hypothetical protein L2E82_39324 [Cichorium intybus]|uniref:Uncharacterized protein n=1 Tax=Cichorium intybus TaxID=13427 RepID=A0ACB9AIW2_CICIN|nr:hypothetical protein L2E82_39324 [Cichorium intybus]
MSKPPLNYQFKPISAILSTFLSFPFFLFLTQAASGHLLQQAPATSTPSAGNSLPSSSVGEIFPVSGCCRQLPEVVRTAGGVFPFSKKNSRTTAKVFRPSLRLPPFAASVFKHPLKIHGQAVHLRLHHHRLLLKVLT